MLSDDQKIRAAAIKELPKVIAEMDIQNLALMISALIQETGQIGTKDDSAPQNSWKAQEALLAIGTPALPYLLETLKIQVEYPPIKPGWVYVLVRDNVARLLGQFKPPVTKAVALLVEEVKKTKSANAAEALGQIGVSSPQVINTLQELLKDYTWPESTYVIVAAVKALHQLGVKPLPTAEIVKKLSAQLKGEGLLPSEHRIYAQMEAAHALLSLNPDNKEAVEILIEGMEKTTDSGVFSIIEQIGPPAKDVVPKLIEKLKGYYPIPVMAALKSIGTPEALKAVNEYVRAGHSINILDNNQKNELQNSEIKKQYIVTVKGVSTTSTARASYNFSFHIESPNKEEFTSVSVGLYDTDEQLLNELAVEWDEESLVHRVATSFRKDKRYRMSIIPGDYKCENVVLESEDKEFHWTTYGRKPCPQISYEKYDLLAVLADKTLPIQATYLSKIVYTRDNDFNQDVLIKDCQKRGGVFNECGTICNDQSKEWPCPTPTGCAFTCEFKGEKK